MSRNPNTDEPEIRELWLYFARPVFPKRSDEYICEMKMIAAAYWLNGLDNDLAKAYDKFVMMRKLKDLRETLIKHED
jgi:hypothetical protein